MSSAPGGAAPAPDGNNSSAGAASNGARGNNNDRRGGAAGRRNNNNNRAAPVPEFEGSEPLLKGFYYDMPNPMNYDQFDKTTKKVAIVMGSDMGMYAPELSAAFADMNIVRPVHPAVPNDQADLVQVHIWKMRYQECETKNKAFGAFEALLYLKVLGQCTDALKDRIIRHEDYAATELARSGFGLLAIIEAITFGVEGRRNRVVTVNAAKDKCTKIRQGNMDLRKYYEKYKSAYAAALRAGATFEDHAIVTEMATIHGRGGAPTVADRMEARDYCIAVRFIEQSNSTKYITELNNAQLEGDNKYPRTLEAAYEILLLRGPEVHRQNHQSGVAFTTVAAGAAAGGRVIVPGTDGRTFANIDCRDCGGWGHYAQQCPQMGGNNGGEGANQIGYSFSQVERLARKFKIPLWWILLDSQSTVDVFCNAALLVNIHTVDHRMYIHCNAGTMWTDQQGDLPGYGRVWYCQNAIANILSLHNVSRRYRVEFNSKEGNQFVVTKDDGKMNVFRVSANGLYYYDVNAAAAMDNNATVLVTTVNENKTRYTNAEVSMAETARALQRKLGHVSTKEFIHIVNNNLLPNCPVTKRDIMASEDIFGPELGLLKGKTVRRSPLKVDTNITYIPLPPSVHERYQEVTLSADIMYVNKVPFFVTVSRKIKFGTIEALDKQTESRLFKAIQNVIRVYHHGGFRVRHVLMDGQFECLRGALLGMQVLLNTTSRDEHVGDIERYIWTIKERMRCTATTVPFETMTSTMTLELGKRTVFWLNAFPAADGISTTLSPRTIVTGQIVNHDQHCTYDFGEYVQTHEEHDNTMAPRTIGALAMRPTGNAQGSYYFLSLSSGRIINWLKATPLPMPHEVIDRVRRMARQQKANRGLVFLDRNKQPFTDDIDDDLTPPDDDDEEDDEDDESYHPDDEDSDGQDSDSGSDSSSDSGSDSGSDSESDSGSDSGSEVGSEAGSDPDSGSDRDVDEDDVLVVETVDEDEEDDADGINADEEDRSVDVDDASGEDRSVGGDDVGGEDRSVASDEGPTEDLLANDMDNRYGARTGHYSLRARKPRSYGHLHSTVHVEASAHVAEPMTPEPMTNSTPTGDDERGSLATPQMSMKRGLKLFGEDGVSAVGAEIKQLHDRAVMKPATATELTFEQRKEALAYLMFLKRKRTGVVKGRGCADRRKQRAYTDKEEATSPTIATEAVFLCAVIDAQERRNVAIVDVPGAFMQADMPEDETVHVRLTGIMVDILLDIDHDMYAPFVTYEGKDKVLYVELLKALYGTLRAARLFWEKLSGKLLEWGFEANPYDSCVVNKMINGKQCTIGWHVDDLRISHVDAAVVDHVIDQMEEEFGKEAPLTVSRDQVHEYLGMRFDFTERGAVTVDMSDYVKAVIADMPQDMIGKAVTPAANHLFDIRENSVPIEKEKADAFHKTVMQLQYLSQRARPDIRTAVSFLCKRLSAPDLDNYKKLTRVMRYLQSTIYLKLKLESDGSGIIRWWVDASYAVHPDMKGHTGGTLSMGKGSIYSVATGQKLVARSSTEAELIGVHDLMPQIVWTSYFLQAQGQQVTDSILYQDNMSSILLEKNGRSSSTKRTRHINIRFFFVKDRVANGEVRIEHCPTLDMLADYFTKPLQGALFYKLRDQIMNIDPSSEYHSSAHRSVLSSDEKNPDMPPDGKAPGSVRFAAATQNAKELRATRSYADVVTG
jgi:Reverse transcriptase (RNA-dependent DNA polymerase)